MRSPVSSIGSSSLLSVPDRSSGISSGNQQPGLEEGGTTLEDRLFSTLGLGGGETYQPNLAPGPVNLGSGPQGGLADLGPGHQRSQTPRAFAGAHVAPARPGGGGVSRAQTPYRFGQNGVLGQGPSARHAGLGPPPSPSTMPDVSMRTGAPPSVAERAGWTPHGTTYLTPPVTGTNAEPRDDAFQRGCTPPCQLALPRRRPTGRMRMSWRRNPSFLRHCWGSSTGKTDSRLARLGGSNTSTSRRRACGQTRNVARTFCCTFASSTSQQRSAAQRFFFLGATWFPFLSTVDGSGTHSPLCTCCSHTRFTSCSSVHRIICLHRGHCTTRR